jgi:hypothetical protein
VLSSRSSKVRIDPKFYVTARVRVPKASNGARPCRVPPLLRRPREAHGPAVRPTEQEGLTGVLVESGVAPFADARTQHS